MATVATLTRVIQVPNLSAFGGPVDSAVSTIINAINALSPTIPPTIEQTRDNAMVIITVAWPSATDASFVSGGTMATVATSLGLATLNTYQVTSTSAY